MLTSKDFWAASLERAVTAFAAALLAAIGSNQIGVLDIDWVGSASLAATTAVLSILTSIVSAGSSETNSVAAFGPERRKAAPAPVAKKKAPAKKKK